MSDIEPERENQAPYIRSSSKKILGVFDEVHAEPFEIIESNYFKKLIKGGHPSLMQQNITPRNLQFETEKIEKKVQTSSFLEADYYNLKNESEFQNMNSLREFKTISELRTFKNLASLRNLSRQSM